MHNGELFEQYFKESSHSIVIVSIPQRAIDTSCLPVIEANAACLRMFGCSSAPRFLSEMFTGRYQTINEKLIKAVGQSKKNIRINLPEIGRSYEVSFTYLKNGTASIDFLDVSDQAEDLRLMLAEQALHKSQIRYSLLLNEMKNVFVSFRIQEQDGRLHSISYCDANPSFQKLIGASISQLAGMSPIGQFITDDSQYIIDQIFNTYKTGRPAHFILHNSGLGIYLDASAYRFDDTIVALVASNITGLKLTEHELRLAKDKAEESERLKTSFLANMSHEIRTPLNGILGFSKLLARAGLSEEKKNHYISLIDNNGNHLMSIISDILDIAKIESNQLELHKSDVMLNALFDGLLEMSNTILSKKEKEQLTISTSKGLPSALSVMHTDPLRLTQVLRNLIENAIKFTQSGTVNFGYKEYGDKHLYFYVKDTGIGISQENLQIIFQHFRQEDETITRKFGGTGLGLSICKHLVKHLGGEIGVESEKGKGSTFYFVLPFKRNEQATNRPVQVKPQAEQDRSIRIACCSNPDMVNFFSDSTVDTRLEIVSCAEIANILEDCTSGIYQAAIIDIATYGTKATEMLNTLKQAMPFFPVFAATFDLLETDRSFYARLGYNDIFDLNTDATTLSSRIKYYLGL